MASNPTDRAALAARLEEMADGDHDERMRRGPVCECGGVWPCATRADLLAAAAALREPVRAPSASVAEARADVAEAVADLADAERTPEAFDAAWSGVHAALDRYAAAIRADVPPEVREIATRMAREIHGECDDVTVAVLGDLGRVNPLARVRDLRALARHGGAT